ncbi:Piso0_000083 [Millerozyma farinosa CBS 7064]|uniref:Piso0_000083 protein n=1 Tax=Pichia sorbitophila (strain ATCC MYA-4447 / BCRC 22081 / CBS 7064 / NBRC 10061 / NRRL Y-12695) TaxID=559304 RepID=G8YT19_PICSO|nr:Piso0_000083 [Millerozyma farinosa CBS 7064]
MPKTETDSEGFENSDQSADEGYEAKNRQGVNGRRTRKRVSYKEDLIEEDADFEGGDAEAKAAEGKITTGGRESNDDDVLASSSDSPEPTGEENDEYVDDGPSSEDEEAAKPSNRRKRTRRTAQLSDDSDFEDDLSEASDEYLEKLKEKDFIASDDDLEDNEYKSRRPSRRSRSRSRSLEPRKQKRTIVDDKSDEEEREEEDTIQKEIEDLYDSSPNNEPVKHKLRERGTKVDYRIPPAITNDSLLGAFNAPTSTPPASRGRGRRVNPTKNEYRKLLFPTAGPFGGSDVISLFGTNIPPGGIPVPGLNNDSLSLNKNMSDSDSSDDEIKPINGDMSHIRAPKVSKAGEGNKLITGGSSEQKNKKNNLSDTDPLGVDMSIDFSSVGGLDNYITQLKEMVQLPLLYPELYQNFSITPPRGVLFHGPPGTGKTLMARALASSCSTSQRKITFFMRKGADCLSKWVGEAERQLRLLFEEAKNQQPSIIFFDEIDGLAPVRSSKQEQIHASIVSTLLALMDGMDNRGQVIVIGATNRPDAVDPALRRPGRFDREFYFPLPDLKARTEILNINTRKWVPRPSETFIQRVAELTKGYGGADLRALCTEAALSSIQRKYPQIYRSNDKLKVNPSRVRVTARDFMQALDKIVPSSARSTSSPSAPLSDNIKPLLNATFEQIKLRINKLFPEYAQKIRNRKMTILDEVEYADPTLKDSDGGFSRQQLLKDLENSRTYRPYLMLCGRKGNGQKYLSSGILNYLEDFQIQSLDLGYIFGDPTRSPESCIIQAFVEARRHQPSVILIPNIDIWYGVVPYSAKALLVSLLNSLKSNEKVLFLGVAEATISELNPEISELFDSRNKLRYVSLRDPIREERKDYFSKLKKALYMKPFEFVNDIENRPKRRLKKLEVVPIAKDENSEVLHKKKMKQIEHDDTRLKNVLKIKLAGLMDLFKNRYKRFRKPIIDESLLYHLFDPTVLQNPLNNYEVLYEKSTSPEHKDMVYEIATGKYYHNMDLDVIEERLWNGYYSEPRQFLKDIKMIVKDAITSGDRERILKANEMLTNTQFGIDEFSAPEFLRACKEMRYREIQRQADLLKEHKILEDNFRQKQLDNIQQLTDVKGNNVGLRNGSSARIEEIPNKTVPTPAIPTDKEPAAALQSNNDEINNKEHLSDDVSSNQLEKPHDGEKSPVANGSEMQVDEVNDAEDTESEVEVPIDTSRELNIGDKFQNFFDNELLDVTENFTVEALESLMASLMDIVMEDKNKWDRTETVQRLIDTALNFYAS